MILLCGLSSETPLCRVAEALEAAGEPFVWFRQRDLATTRIRAEARGGSVRGTLEIGGATYPLEAFTGVYARLMEDAVLPETRAEPEGSAAREHARTLHETLTAWTEAVPDGETRVVNRASAMASNNSKPYQAQTITRHGFRTPETLVTNDPDSAREFRDRHGEVIYKSVSGVRSVVRTFTPDDDARLESIRWCPTQFQARVPGADIRVHVIADRAVFATTIETDAADYRYASRDGREVTLAPRALPDEIAARCVALARAFGLLFAGIDLRLAPDGAYYCFEVNPSPAFTYYEAHTGQPIAATLARFLTGR
jgi:glutathione synthase/RimK-type ligase-like ATP-grasp enzyme